MTFLNQITLLGRLSKHPEELKTMDNESFVKLSLETSELYKNSQGKWEEKTQLHMIYASDQANTSI